MRREAKISQTFPAEEPRIHAERQSQALIEAFLASGLFFLLLPGTFLGVWNLIGISRHEALTALSSSVASGAWSGTGLRLGRVVHPWHRLLFADKDAEYPHVSGRQGLDIMEPLDLWSGSALAGRSDRLALAVDPAGVGIARTRRISTLLLGRASPPAGQWAISETHVDGSGDFIHLGLPSYACHQRHCPVSTGAHGQYSGAPTSARSSTCNDGNLGCPGAHYLGIQRAVAADLCRVRAAAPQMAVRSIRVSAWPASLWSFSINGESLL